jgi:acetoacetate decarboxylase
MDARCVNDDFKNGLGLHCFGDYSQVVDFAFRGTRGARASMIWVRSTLPLACFRN